MAPPVPNCSSAIVMRSPFWNCVPPLVILILSMAPSALTTTLNSASLPNLSVVHKLTAYVPAVLDASSCGSNATDVIFDLPSISPSNSASR